MSDTNTVASYLLMKITELTNRLVAIVLEVMDEELVSIALNGFSSAWDHFVWSVCAHEKRPNLCMLWNDFI
jgi:hypothetical protein